MLIIEIRESNAYKLLFKINDKYQYIHMPYYPSWIFI